MPKGATMRASLLAAPLALALAVSACVGVATAGPAAKQQRIMIDFHSLEKRFVMTPLTSGPLRPDSGPYTSCCWTRRFYTRAGESVEVDNPIVFMTGTRGTITWRERISFVDVNHDYTVSTAVWTIVHGTGAYAHLEGHGREAAVDRTAENVEVAAEAEGLIDLNGGRK
jgi:hypothetical protein